MILNLADYDEIEVDPNFKPEIGDIVFHPRFYGTGEGTIEIVVSEDTDLIQEEFYPLLLNFGCMLLRKKA